MNSRQRLHPEGRILAAPNLFLAPIRSFFCNSECFFLL